MKFANRVFETSTSTGTGPFALAGAPVGRKTFAQAFSTGDSQIAVTIEDATGAYWIVALATLVSSTSLQIDSILDSSNGGQGISFGAGTKNVFVDLPASVLMALVNAAPAPAPSPSPSPAPSPAPGPDTKPGFYLANTGVSAATALAGRTDLTGSSNGGKAGNAVIPSTASDAYVWFFVLSTAGTPTFHDDTSNLNGGFTLIDTVSDGNGNTFNRYRSDFAGAYTSTYYPSGASITLS